MKNEYQLTSSADFEYRHEICVFLFVFPHLTREVRNFSISVAERSGDKFQALT